jgi:Phosphoribosylformylglycinamidine (FGAM) synthase, synthetase domain
MIYTVIDAVDREILRAAHDISNGGMAITAAEMCMLSDHGISIDISDLGDMRSDKLLFSESSGFVVEVADGAEQEFVSIARSYDLNPVRLGSVSTGDIEMARDGKMLVRLDPEEAREAWSSGLREAMR